MNAGRPRQSRTTPVRHALALAGLFLLAACGRSETDIETERAAQAANPAGLSPRGAGLSRVVADSVGSPFSAVAADESRAAEIGRDILLAGGNAADAAVAMYFAMAVTLPSAASLGASGACIVHNDKTKAAEAFVFPPIAAQGTVGGQPFIVPSGVRAITLMHVRHGQLRWEATVAPAERLARFGVPLSRALSRDLQSAGAALGGDREARRIFGGGAMAEGTTLTQPELAGTLGAIRQRGGVDFFQGQVARTMSEQIAQMGGSLPLESLRAAVPQASAPTAEGYGRRRVYVAPAPAAGTSALAGWKGQAPSGPTPTDSGGFSGLVAVDGKAGAAACTLSMGQTFGARAVVPGVGVLLGAPSPGAGSVSPVIIANPGNGEFSFVGAGGGAATAAQAAGYVAYATIERDQPLANVLTSRGGQGGWVNAIVCPSGLRGSGSGCRSAIDPAGAGLALIAR
jgi:gamma-glutamyltranspeptidase/glutathione hydrolase